MSKIFGIGLAKTGTSSLTIALQVLGYKAVHCPHNLSIIPKVDAATDSIIARHYKALDETYPNSKFILTVRDFDEWLVSCEFFFQGMEDIVPNNEVRDEVNQKLYGGRQFHSERFTNAYNDHMKDVADYFADRPQDLLTLDICGGEGWTPLCSFLGHQTRRGAFPWKNKR